MEDTAFLFILVYLVMALTSIFLVLLFLEVCRHPIGEW